MLRFLTAGESHGKALVAILEGMPAGLAIDFDAITADLRRRQTGYGRGRRMLIESDRAEALSGVRRGESTGGPIALLALQGISELIKRVAFLNDYPVDSLEAHYERPTQ